MLIMDEKTIFDKVYKNREWGDGESVSGTGSYLESTKHLIRELPFLFSRYGIRSILDIPCGDFNWMKEVNLSGINYIGDFIVEGINEKDGYQADRAMCLWNIYSL